jgi:phosphohistidine swiveling domain-containing protein
VLLACDPHEVSIITSVQQSQQIAKGDVLVCNTNRIEDAYGRAGELASAIVTDDSREMALLSKLDYNLKVPCVAGTTYATQVLHARMSIPVDPTAGIVYGINEDGEAGTNVQDRKRILIVCGGNTCRSPMAKAILEQKFKASGALGGFGH